MIVCVFPSEPILQHSVIISFPCELRFLLLELYSKKFSCFHVFHSFSITLIFKKSHDEKHLNLLAGSWDLGSWGLGSWGPANRTDQNQVDISSGCGLFWSQMSTLTHSLV